MNKRLAVDAGAANTVGGEQVREIEFLAEHSARHVAEIGRDRPSKTL